MVFRSMVVVQWLHLALDEIWKELNWIAQRCITRWVSVYMRISYSTNARELCCTKYFDEIECARLDVLVWMR